ncbi:MAG TPA: TonB family protein [Longimicrobiales bacterium]|nr:TonB family protein [Longimicrobiales bacterium]
MTFLPALLVLAAASPAGSPGTQPGTVHGVIRSAAGSSPVAYANVEVVGRGISAWTDAAGSYRLDSLPEGRWRIRVNHPNHDSLALEVFVPSDRGVALDLTLEPRPGPAVDALGDFEPFRVEYTLPALLNTEEMTRLIEGTYPPDLAEEGVGGETVLRLWLDERGQVVRTRVSRSSGHLALDSVAERVAGHMRFRPAKNRDEAVRVIVQIPVLFTVPAPAVAAGGSPR